MTSSAERLGSWDDDQLVAVADPVHRYVSSRLSDRHSVEDIVQETLARLLGARDRLDGSSLLPYAIVTARNLVTEHSRDADRHRRHAHRVIDLRQPDRPEDVLLASEERAALGAALDALPTADRRLLLAHEVDGTDTATLAAEQGTTPGSVAARLARARARLRVGYVVALRRTELPTVRCRPVLLALSAGDRRRQRALQAGRHLLACQTCAATSGPLLERNRGIAGWAPWVWGPALVDVVRRRARTRSAQALTGATVVAAVAVVAAANRHEAPTTPAATRNVQPSTSTGVTPRPSLAPVIPGLVVAGAGLRSGPGMSYAATIGRPVRATRVLVLSVPPDEGFWVGIDSEHRVWVQLRTGSESGPRVRAGQRVSFTGAMVRTSSSFASAAGITSAEGARPLTVQAAHVQVPVASLRIVSP